MKEERMLELGAFLPRRQCGSKDQFSFCKYART